MSDAPRLIGIVAQVAGPLGTEREKAVALHDYVRDNVRFGFNRYFDAAEPEFTLACGRGHCNSKSRLMVALFRAAGLESFLHFVALPKRILNGALPASRFWMIPAELSHSYVEVKVAGVWCAIDSHILDTPLLEAARERLLQEGRLLGYGARVNSTNVWDGQSDAFSQFDPGLMIEDHGRVDDLEAYFRGRQYRHRVLGLSFNTLFKFMGEPGVAAINAHLDRLRHDAPSPAATTAAAH
jgi:hypothetical protein